MVLRASCWLTFLLLPWSAIAHHAIVATFDQSVDLDFEGRVTQVLWQNPHVRLTIQVVEDGNVSSQWQVESQSVSTLRRMNVTDTLIRVGDNIRVAGHPSRSQANQMWADNILLSNGQEIVTRPGIEPRWSDNPFGTSGPGFATLGDTSRPEYGIFRTWSTPFSAPWLFPESVDPTFDFSRYPLTSEARSVLEEFDPSTTRAPGRNCSPKGMPTIMEQPFPMEIVDQAQSIVLRMEEYDTTRTIQLDSSGAPTDPIASPLGRSWGHWEGETLVVRTTHINWPYFDTVGIPLSESVEVVERFTPTRNGSRLDYQMTVADPATFTEPVVLEKYWLWLPDVEIHAYSCG